MIHTCLTYTLTIQFTCENDTLYVCHRGKGEMEDTDSDGTHVSDIYTSPTIYVWKRRTVRVPRRQRINKRHCQWWNTRDSYTAHVQCHVFMSQWLIQSASFFHVEHMNEAPFVSHTPVTLSHWLIYSATFVWDSDSYTAPESVTYTQRLCFHVRHMNEALYLSLCVSDSYTAHRFFLSSWLMYSAWISDSLCSCFQPCPPPSKKICNKKIKWESAWKR